MSNQSRTPDVEIIDDSDWDDGPGPFVVVIRPDDGYALHLSKRQARALRRRLDKALSKFK